MYNIIIKSTLLETGFKVLKNCFNFSGRASRGEFWQFNFYALLLMVAVFCIFGYTTMPIMGFFIRRLNENLYNLFTIVFVVFYACLILLWIITNISLSVRRLHDLNFSGWWYLFTFIPFVAPLFFIIFLFPGNKKANRFGPPIETKKLQTFDIITLISTFLFIIAIFYY